MNLGFGDAILVLGVLLAIAAALSGLMRGTVLSISVLSVALGIGLAETGAVTVSATSPGVIDVIEIALILTLFSDGLFVERELLRVHWGPVTRAIVVAMPITLGILRPDRAQRVSEPVVGGGVPAGRGADADRPRRHLGRRHGAARARAGPPHAEPGVGAQ